MAQKIKKLSKKCVAFICMITLVFTASVVTNKSGAQVAATDVKLTISDSRPDETGVQYTLELTGSTTVKCLKVVFSTASTGGTTPPTGFSNATGTEVADWVIFDEATWTTDFTTTAGTITTTLDTVTDISGGTAKVIFGGIVNPTAAGTIYAQVDTFGNTDCSTTPLDTGVAAAYIIAEVEVSATIGESLSVAVNAVTTGDCLADTGFTAAAASTSTSIPFGGIASNTFYNICQELVISTNALDGYSATIQEDDQLTDGTNFISAANDDGNCDGSCTDTTAAVWTGVTDTSDGFGYCMVDTTGDAAGTSGWSQQCAGGGSVTTFKTIASMADGDAVDDIMSSAAAVFGDTADVMFSLQVNSTQPGGEYTNKIIYIVTPQYN